MRIFQSAPTLLTPYQQKKKDEDAAQQTETKTTETKPEPVVSEVVEEATKEDVSQPQAETEVVEPVVADPKTDQSVDTSRKEVKPSKRTVTKPKKSETKNVLTDEEERALEEQKLLDAIFDVENDRLALEEEVGTMTQILGDLQSQLSEATKTRRMLLDELPESLIQIRSGESAEAIVAKTKEDAKEALKPIVLQWHERPLVEIAKGIEGLGPAKLIKLCDACPTIGDANNNRIAAQQMKEHFADRLPRGIGKRIANQLETRIIEAETNHDTPSAAQQVKQNGTQDGTTETSETVTPGRDPHVRLVNSIVRSLRATATRESLFFDEDTDAQDGFVAYESGTPETECPKFDSNDEDRTPRITQWLKGWLLNELIQKEQLETETTNTESFSHEVAAVDSLGRQPQDNETLESESPEGAAQKPEQPITTSEPDPSQSPNSDQEVEAHSLAVQTLAEQIKVAGDFGQAAANENWPLGYEAAIDELPVEACPADLNNEDTSQWIKGWFNANEFGGGL